MNTRGSERHTSVQNALRGALITELESQKLLAIEDGEDPQETGVA